MRNNILLIIAIVCVAQLTADGQQDYLVSGDFFNAAPGVTTLEEITPLVQIADADGLVVQVLTSSLCSDPDHPDAAYAICFNGPADLSPGQQFAVTLKRTADPLNGVSTLDLVLLQRHILGIELLGGNAIRAADVNLSASASALDMVEMRRLILAISTTYQSEESWIFLHQGGTDRFAYFLPDMLPAPGVDFRPIKLGDLNGTAIF